MEDVRASSAWVAAHSSHVTVDFSGIEKVAGSIKDSIPKVEWDYEGNHYFDNGPLTVQYLFVLDALNFCFWPGGNLISSSNKFLVSSTPLSTKSIVGVAQQVDTGVVKVPSVQIL